MMKQWSRICFLVLAISNISRGQNETASQQDNDHEDKNNTTENPTPLHEGKIAEEPILSISKPPQTNMSVNATDQDSTPTQTEETENLNGTNTTEEVSSSTVAPQTTSAGTAESTTRPGDVTTVPMATASPSAEIKSGGSSWAYVILVLIILVIIILCIILYFLRRVSRSYSFDLQRPSPSCPLNEPTGTFEPVYLDDLDRPVPKDEVTTDLSPPPVANGTNLPSEEMGSSRETAPPEQPDANGVETPVSNTSPTSGDDSADKPSSPANSASLFFDALGDEQQQNENNNNPSVCSSDPFVEINLDEPALCDQLLTSPEATSSVLPFSFSFSSNS